MITVGGSHIGSRRPTSDAQAVNQAGDRKAGSARLTRRNSIRTAEARYATESSSPRNTASTCLFHKTMAEDADTARSHLENSLKHMKTDYVDLWE